MPLELQAHIKFFVVAMFVSGCWSSMDSTSLFLIGFTTFFSIIIIYSLEKWNYFSRRNVKFIRGWPMVGSLHEFFFGNKSFFDVTLKLYRHFADEPFVGIYELTHPVFIIRDPDLIKQITVQDFDHFSNHQGNFDVNVDPLMARSLFFLKDQQWKEMRSILSPAFTGNKMRLMFNLIYHTTVEFMKSLETIEDRENGFEIEQKDLFSRYATNVIASSAFGLKVDAVAERENEFYLAGKEITNFDGIQGVKLLALDVIPWIIKWCGIEFLNRKVCDYFRNVVNTAIAYRNETHLYRPDMIHLLMKASKGTLNDVDDIESVANKTNKMNWVDDDLVAQCLVFLFAGSETTSTLLSFMGYELARNQHIQQRLYEKIMEIEANLNGQTITYELINDFKYMDMIVSEVVRLWPPIPNVDRHVTKPYRLRGKNGVQVTLHVNDDIWIPVNGLHLDPKYWTEPAHFDPERFSDNNRKNIRPGTFAPFGYGQRSCIGSRFALMVAKTVFYFVLREYQIERCDKMSDPIILMPNSINVHAKDGLWVRFQRRNKCAN